MYAHIERIANLNNSEFFVHLKSLQFRTPINWLLMNLSFTELIIILTGNVTLTTNAYYRSSSIIIIITISVFNFMINSWSAHYLPKTKNCVSVPEAE